MHSKWRNGMFLVLCLCTAGVPWTVNKGMVCLWYLSFSCFVLVQIEMFIRCIFYWQSHNQVSRSVNPPWHCNWLYNIWPLSPVLNNTLPRKSIVAFTRSGIQCYREYCSLAPRRFFLLELPCIYLSSPCLLVELLLFSHTVT